MMKLNEEKEESRIKYLTRKYGRVTIIFSFLILALMEYTGVRSTLTNSLVSVSSSENVVAFRGSKSINPSTTGEFWTSNKFKF